MWKALAIKEATKRYTHDTAEKQRDVNPGDICRRPRFLEKKITLNITLFYLDLDISTSVGYVIGNANKITRGWYI